MRISKKLLLLLGGEDAYASLIRSLSAVSWWDASSSTLYQLSNATTPATADGDNVGYMVDKINATYSPIQATAGIRPNLKLAIQNGLNVIRFAAGDILATTEPIVTGMEYTIFLAWQRTSGTLPWYNGVSGGGANGYGAYFDGNSNILMGGVAAKVNGVDAGGAQVFCISHTSGNSKMFVNAEAKTISSAALNPTVPVTTSTLLGINAAMDFFECVMFDRQLTDAEVTGVTAAMRTKWGF